MVLTYEWTYHGWWCVTEFTILFKSRQRRYGMYIHQHVAFFVLHNTKFMLLKLHSPILYRDDRGYKSTHACYECISNIHVVDVYVTISVSKKWKTILLHTEYISQRKCRGLCSFISSLHSCSILSLINGNIHFRNFLVILTEFLWHSKKRNWWIQNLSGILILLAAYMKNVPKLVYPRRWQIALLFTV